MVEGLQQLAVFLLEHGQWQSGRAVRARLVAVEGVKFRGIVGPGETLTCRVEAASVSESGAAAAATVSKGGDEIASCRLIFAWAPDDPAGAADRIERLLRAWDWGPPAASAPSISR
jgi:3-hydroxymyristoyl/3-hydroxydecanoyl-(acyl carrier protein) dehydratase